MAIRIPIIFIILFASFVQPLPHPDFQNKPQRNGVFDLQHDLNQKESHVHHHRRVPREIRVLKLRDPLDCLSQVVCGLNTFPPQKPSVRTSTANDFAFLLKTAVSKLRRQKIVTSTTTTIAPATKRSTTKAPLDDDDDDGEYDDDDYTQENDVDYNNFEREDDFDNYSHPPRYRKGRAKRVSVFENSDRDARAKKRSKKKQKPKKKEKKKGKNKFPGPLPPMKPKGPTPLDRLRMETNLRLKLLSDAQCINGLIDHSCPFNYHQMLNLISSSLERERTVSYSSQKVLPMVGYLIKSRNYTGTIAATFKAIEQINNYTLEADREGKPIDFSHILDEVLNRVTGDTGLRIVDTSNDSASASVWEDDEFDHVLQNPYERKRPASDNYKVDPKKKLSVKSKATASGTGNKAAEQADESTTSEEDTSEEGLVFDRPSPISGRPPPNHSNGPQDGESSSEEDDEKELAAQVQLEAKKKLEEMEKQKKEKRKKLSSLAISDSKKKLSPPPVFSFGHLQKSAEEE